MTTRQKLRSQAPTVLILIFGTLAYFHVADQGLMLALEALLVGYVLGKARVTFAESERLRRAAIAHTEAFIVWMQRQLDEDEVPLTQRESAEHALEAAVVSLDIMERSAAPWTRWRERRARERASS